MEGGVDVSDVLGALEDAESQGGEEIASGQKAGGRSEGEAGALGQEVGHFLELGNVLGVEDALLLQTPEDSLVFGASMLWHQVDHGVEDRFPGLVLGFGVFDVWDWVTTGTTKKV